MSEAPVDPTSTEAWSRLAALAEDFEPDLRAWFAAQPDRVERLTFTAADLHVDLSKSFLDDEVLAALLALAEEVGVERRRDAMFAGEHINVTEDRAVLHTALRDPAGMTLEVDGQEVVADVHDVLARVYAFADQVRSGAWTGVTGQADPDRGQHRDRRLRPRPGDGLRGAGALPAARPGVPVHLQHRPDRRGDHAGRPRSRRRRCSSSRARPSGPSRPSPTHGSARPGCSTGSPSTTPTRR